MVRLRKFPLRVQRVGEELVAVLHDTGIDEDGVDAAEFLIRGFEGGALGGPGGDVALYVQGVGGCVGESWGWGLQVEQDEGVEGVEGGEEGCGCETDA